MKIINPSIQVLKFDGIQLMKNCELAARTCYKSEGLATENSYDKFLRGCLARGHESIIEHEKITLKMICDLGTYKDLTRHRLASFSIESTRYCCYDKDKFGGQLKLIKPVFYDDNYKAWIGNENEEYGRQYECLETSNDNQKKTYYWIECMNEIENRYIDMRNNGATADECRMLLPHSIAAEVVMTANLREWRHILKLRTTNKVHPHVQQTMIPLLLYFQEKMPALFDDIQYNKKFDKEIYATVEEI